MCSCAKRACYGIQGRKPSAFMQEALRRCGIDNTVIVHNPSAVPAAFIPLTIRGKKRFNLAFAGRIAQEKGLAQFIATHLSTPEKRYEVSEYLPEHYAERLAQIMRLGEDPTPSVHPEFAAHSFQSSNVLR